MIEAPRHRKAIIGFSVLAFCFWLLEFIIQYYWLAAGDLPASLVRSLALSGATLISSALFASVIFRWIPRTAQYWRVRRYLGVSGTTLIVLHALATYYFYYNFDLAQIYYTLNPVKNPLVFGTIGLSIFTVMALISSDWAVAKLTPRVWKFIHRFVYVAYLAAVFHFTTINPGLLKNPPGYLLLALTTLVIFGHLELFIKIAWRKRFQSLGSWVGVVIIVSALAVAYLTYFR